MGLRQFICCNEHLFPQQVVDMDLIVQVHKTHLIQGPSWSVSTATPALHVTRSFQCRKDVLAFKDIAANMLLHAFTSTNNFVWVPWSDDFFSGILRTRKSTHTEMLQPTAKGAWSSHAWDPSKILKNYIWMSSHTNSWQDGGQKTLKERLRHCIPACARSRWTNAMGSIYIASRSQECHTAMNLPMMSIQWSPPCFELTQKTKLLAMKPAM